MTEKPIGCQCPWSRSSVKLAYMGRQLVEARPARNLIFPAKHSEAAHLVSALRYGRYRPSLGHTVGLARPQRSTHSGYLLIVGSFSLAEQQHTHFNI